MMSKVAWIVVVSAFLGSFAPVNPAAAAEPGCVDLLTDCGANTDLLETVCGPGVHTLSPPVSDNISYVRFGANVRRVVLTTCSPGSKFVITQDTNLCELDSTNDNVCAIEIALGTAAAPTLDGAGIGLVILALLTLGVIRLRRWST